MNWPRDYKKQVCSSFYEANLVIKSYKDSGSENYRLIHGYRGKEFSKKYLANWIQQYMKKIISWQIGFMLEMQDQFNIAEFISSMDAMRETMWLP